MARILNPLLSIKVPLKVAYKPSDWLQAAFRSTFIDKRGFRIWAIKDSIEQSCAYVCMRVRVTSFLYINTVFL